MATQECRTCKSCERSLPIADFYTDIRTKDGYDRDCKDCAKERSRQYYAKNRESVVKRVSNYFKSDKGKLVAEKNQKNMVARYPEKRRARSMVRFGLITGKIQKQPCEVCGTLDNIEAHHKDYSKQLEVRWLCSQHHRQEDGRVADRIKELKGRTK